MMRIATDFNSRDLDGALLVLLYREIDVNEQISEMNLSEGQKIIVYQIGEPEDFEVTAALELRYDKFLQKERWVAIPDYSTLVRHPLA